MEREVLFSILAASLFGTTVWALAFGVSCTIPRLAESEPRA